MASDRLFFDDLIVRCQEAGIPIRVRAEEISGLLYPLAITIIHEEDVAADAFSSSSDVFLELVAAYCLGEVEIQARKPAPTPGPGEGGQE